MRGPTTLRVKGLRISRNLCVISIDPRLSRTPDIVVFDLKSFPSVPTVVLTVCAPPTPRVFSDPIQDRGSKLGATRKSLLFRLARAHVHF